MNNALTKVYRASAWVNFESISSLRVLRGHQRHVHKAAKSFCPVCEENFSRQDNLQRHMSDVHKEATPVYCSHCEKGFSRIVSLERHISEVHKKTSHRCPKCNMFFTREETLDRHISDVHKKEKNWECEHCPEDYSRWENLKRHLARGSHTFFMEGGCPHCKEDPSFKSKSEMNAHFISYRNIHNSRRETCVTMKRRNAEERAKERKPWEEREKQRKKSTFECGVCKKVIRGFEEEHCYLVDSLDRTEGCPYNSCKTTLLRPEPKKIAMNRETPLEFSCNSLKCGCGCGAIYGNTYQPFHY